MSNNSYHHYNKQSDSKSYSRSGNINSQQQYSATSYPQNNNGYPKTRGGTTNANHRGLRSSVGGAAAYQGSSQRGNAGYDEQAHNYDNHQQQSYSRATTDYESANNYTNTRESGRYPNGGGSYRGKGQGQSGTYNHQRRYQDGGTTNNPQYQDPYYQDEYYQEEEHLEVKKNGGKDIYTTDSGAASYASKNTYYKDKNNNSQHYNFKQGKTTQYSNYHQQRSNEEAYGDDYYNEEEPSQSKKEDTYYGNKSNYSANTYSSRAQNSTNSGPSHSQNYKQTGKYDYDYNEDPYYESSRGPKKTTTKYQSNYPQEKRPFNNNKYAPHQHDYIQDDDTYLEPSPSMPHYNNPNTTSTTAYAQDFSETKRKPYSHHYYNNDSHYNQSSSNYKTTATVTPFQKRSNHNHYHQHQPMSSGKHQQQSHDSKQYYLNEEEEYNEYDVEEQQQEEAEDGQQIEEQANYKGGQYYNQKTRVANSFNNYKEGDTSWEKNHKRVNEEVQSYKRDEQYMAKREDEAATGSRQYRPKKPTNSNDEDAPNESAITSEKLIITVQRGQGGLKKDEQDLQNQDSQPMPTQPHRRVMVIKQGPSSNKQDKRERRESSSSWASIEDGGSANEQQTSHSVGYQIENQPLKTQNQDQHSIVASTPKIHLNQVDNPSQNFLISPLKNLAKQPLEIQQVSSKVNYEDPLALAKKEQLININPFPMNPSVMSAPPVQQPQLKSLSSVQSFNESPTLKHQLSKNSLPPFTMDDELEHIFKVPEPEYKLLDTMITSQITNSQVQPAVLPVLGSSYSTTQHQNDQQQQQQLQLLLSKQFNQQMSLNHHHQQQQQQQQQADNNTRGINRNSSHSQSPTQQQQQQIEQNVQQQQQQQMWNQNEQGIRQAQLQRHIQGGEYTQFNNQVGLNNQNMPTRTTHYMNQNGQQFINMSQQHQPEPYHQVPIAQNSPPLPGPVAYLDDKPYNGVQYSPSQQQIQFYNNKPQFEGYYSGALYQDPEGLQRGYINHPNIQHSQSMGPMNRYDPRLIRQESTSPGGATTQYQHPQYYQLREQEFQQPHQFSNSMSTSLNQNAQEFIPTKKKLQFLTLSKSESMHVGMMPPFMDGSNYQIGDNIGAVSDMSQYDQTSQSYEQQLYQYQMLQSKSISQQYLNEPQTRIPLDYYPVQRNQSINSGLPFDTPQILHQTQLQRVISYGQPNGLPIQYNPYQQFAGTSNDMPELLDENNEAPLNFHPSSYEDDNQDDLLFDPARIAQALIQDPYEASNDSVRENSAFFKQPTQNLDPNQPPFQVQNGNYYQ